MPVKLVILVTLVALAIIAAPALLYFALVAPLDEPGEASIPLSWYACLVLLVIMSVSAGVALLGVPFYGKFCFTPSRYAGLSCSTFDASPIFFCLSVAAFWVVFWVCVACVLSGARVLARGTSRGA